MRIKVKGDGHNINIPIPTGLIFSKASVKIYLKLAKRCSGRAMEYMSSEREEKVENFLDNMPDEAILAVCAEIMRIKRKHGHWDLVEVKTADGEHIQITL
jgi:hypothetical protein